MAEPFWTGLGGNTSEEEEAPAPPVAEEDDGASLPTPVAPPAPPADRFISSLASSTPEAISAMGAAHDAVQAHPAFNPDGMRDITSTPFGQQIRQAGEAVPGAVDTRVWSAPGSNQVHIGTTGADGQKLMGVSLSHTANGVSVDSAAMNPVLKGGTVWKQHATDLIPAIQSAVGPGSSISINPSIPITDRGLLDGIQGVRHPDGTITGTIPTEPLPPIPRTDPPSSTLQHVLLNRERLLSHVRHAVTPEEPFQASNPNISAAVNTALSMIPGYEDPQTALRATATQPYYSPYRESMRVRQGIGLGAMALGEAAGPLVGKGIQAATEAIPALGTDVGELAGSIGKKLLGEEGTINIPGLRQPAEPVPEGATAGDPTTAWNRFKEGMRGGTGGGAPIDLPTTPRPTTPGMGRPQIPPARPSVRGVPSGQQLPALPSDTELGLPDTGLGAPGGATTGFNLDPSLPAQGIRGARTTAPVLDPRLSPESLDPSLPAVSDLPMSAISPLPDTTKVKATTHDPLHPFDSFTDSFHEIPGSDGQFVAPQNNGVYVITANGGLSGTPIGTVGGVEGPGGARPMGPPHTLSWVSMSPEGLPGEHQPLGQSSDVGALVDLANRHAVADNAGLTPEEVQASERHNPNGLRDFFDMDPAEVKARAGVNAVIDRGGVTPQQREALNQIEPGWAERLHDADGQMIRAEAQRRLDQALDQGLDVSPKRNKAPYTGNNGPIAMSTPEPPGGPGYRPPAAPDVHQIVHVRQPRLPLVRGKEILGPPTGAMTAPWEEEAPSLVPVGERNSWVGSHEPLGEVPPSTTREAFPHLPASEPLNPTPVSSTGEGPSGPPLRTYQGRGAIAPAHLAGLDQPVKPVTGTSLSDLPDREPPAPPAEPSKEEIYKKMLGSWGNRVPQDEARGAAAARAAGTHLGSAEAIIPPPPSEEDITEAIPKAPSRGVEILRKAKLKPK